MKDKQGLSMTAKIITSLAKGSSHFVESDVIYYHKGDRLPSDFPAITVTGESVSSQSILLSPFHSHYLIALKSNGDLDWYKSTPGTAGNLRQIDQTHYSYTVDIECVADDIRNYTYTYGNILDITTNEVHKVYCKQGGSIMNDHSFGDNHLFYAVSPTHYFFAAMKLMGDKTINCVLQEQINDKVVWQVETKDYPELLDISVRSYQGIFISAEYCDYAHLNSMAVDYDGNIVLSLRNVGLVKINHETKQIMWIIGQNRNDFKGIDAIPGKQHGLSYVGDGLLVYDNFGADHGRCIKYVLDETNMTGKNIVYDCLFDKTNTYGSCMPVAKDTLFISHGFAFRDTPYIEEYDFANHKQNMCIAFKRLCPCYNVARGIEITNE